MARKSTGPGGHDWLTIIEGSDLPEVEDGTTFEVVPSAEVELLRAGIQWVRGMCSDREPLEAIDAKLGEILSPGQPPPSGTRVRFTEAHANAGMTLVVLPLTAEHRARGGSWFQALEEGRPDHYRMWMDAREIPEFIEVVGS